MPTYTEKRRRSIWDTLLLVVAGLMIIQGFIPPFDPMPVLFGGGVGAFLAFTRHTRYELYQDALVIRFMAPRKIVVPLAEVQDVRIMKMPLGGRALLVQRADRGALVIMPADPEGFLTLLQARPGADPPPPKLKDDDAEGQAPRKRRAPRRRL